MDFLIEVNIILVIIALFLLAVLAGLYNYWSSGKFLFLF